MKEVEDMNDIKIFTPYRVCPLGAHVDHQHGRVTGFAIDKGVYLDFNRTKDGAVHIKSVNYKGVVEFNIKDFFEKENNWGDFVKGAVQSLSRKYKLQYGIEGIIEGTLPVGGLSSSAAVIITYLNALCKANDIHLNKHEMIEYAIWVERNYIGVNVGKLDQSCEVYSEKDSLLYLDTLDDKYESILKNRNMPDFEIMIVFTGHERNLAGSQYNKRVDECKSTSYYIKSFENTEYGKYEDAYLRDIKEDIFNKYKNMLPKNWSKRAVHYYSEQLRVKQGVEAWRSGDLECFGRLMFESGWSSILNYETGSDGLRELHMIMEQTEGIYGGRFSGAGFNGSSIALIMPEKKETIIKNITDKYLEKFPEMTDTFSIHFCNTADGVRL